MAADYDKYSQYRLGTRVIQNMDPNHYYIRPDADFNQFVPDDSDDYGRRYVSTIGTITTFDMISRQATVFWDDGTKGIYQSDDIKDLRIVDNSTTEIHPEYFACSECKVTIEGILWKCIDCGDYICSGCYHGDKHSLRHRFVRTVDYFSTSDVIEPRSDSNKYALRGIFENSQVIRHPDTTNDQSEDSTPDIGTVVKYELSKQIVHVKWSSDGSEKSYPLGNSGEILLKAIKPTYGPFVYHDHLPFFNELECSRIEGRIARYNQEDPYAYALHQAVLCQDMEMIEHYKKSGANLEARDFFHQTPLYIAVCMGHKDIVEKLMEWGCDPQNCNIWGDSCYTRAVLSKKDEIFKLLFHLNMSKETYASIIYSLIRSNNPDLLNVTLINFVEKQSLNSMFFLNYHGEKIPLFHLTVIHNNYQACEMLIRVGKMDINIRGLTSMKTALHLAGERQNMKILKLLISSKCDVNIANMQGDTALHLIMKRHRRLSIEDAANSDKHMAHKKILEEMAIMLVSNGAKLELTNNKQETAIHLSKDESFVRKLIQASKETGQLESLQELQQIKRRLQNLEEKFTCPVCIDRDKSVIFQCGHAVCSECTGRLHKCPVCREKISQRIKMF